MKYRENMTEAEKRQFEAELALMEDCYLQAAASQDVFGDDFDITNEMDELRKAALNHRGQP